MKRIALCILLSFSSLINAMPVLNPAEPALIKKGILKCDLGDCVGLKIGYRGDFIFNRKYNVNGTNIKKFTFFVNEGVLTLNLWNKLDLYGFVGSATMGAYLSPQDPNLGTQLDAFSTTSSAHTLVGFGVKATICEFVWRKMGITYIGIDAQYEWMTRAPFNTATIQGSSVSTNGLGRDYKEGQVSCGVAHRIHNVIPYIAVKWSNARANASGQIGQVGSLTPGTVLNLGRYRASNQWGMAIGTSLLAAERFLVTAEARFFDESALSVAGNIRF